MYSYYFDVNFDFLNPNSTPLNHPAKRLQITYYVMVSLNPISQNLNFTLFRNPCMISCCYRFQRHLTLTGVNKWLKQKCKKHEKPWQKCCDKENSHRPN